MKKLSILILNGPNINMLGKREPNIYGSHTLQDINNNLLKIAKKEAINIEFFQSNSESELINKTQTILNHNFIILNPAGFTSTSIAWRDALLIMNKPFIEVHISNIYQRESFRQSSYFSDIALGVISGLGIKGYELALLYAIEYLLNHKE